MKRGVLRAGGSGAAHSGIYLLTGPVWSAPRQSGEGTIPS